MTDRRYVILAWSTWAISIGVLILVIGIAAVTNRLMDGPGAAAPVVSTVLFVVAFETVGALLSSKRHSNPIGWLLLGSGVCFVGGAVAVFLSATPRLEVLGNWLGNWIWAVGVALPGTLILLLFPTGSLPSRRWKPVAWLAGGAIIAFVLGSSFAPGAIPGTSSANPVGVGGPLGRAFTVLRWGLGLLIPVSFASIASLAVRFRRGDSLQRQQLKWLVFAGGAGIVVALVGEPVVRAFISDPEFATNVANSIISAGIIVVPVAIGVAILRYRLYDIDLVINKTLVYGSLAGFITAVYVGMVVGIGSAIGRGDEPNLGLSILATALVAVAFQPVRQRVQHLANRLVYGKRATPYEVLSEFGHRMAASYGAEDVLPRMARILAEGTGATEARVWLGAGAELHEAAAWPEGAKGAGPGDSDLLVPVSHQGEELGALSIQKAPGDRVTPAEEKLTTDLASQAGLVLRNVKLIEDLKASRVRLVTAQDSERRRIERNIHDGAQQQLVALNVKLGLTRTIAPKDPVKAEKLLTELQEETNQALQDLRDLARGIYPPLLQDQGLRAALEAQARKSPLPVTVEADSIGRYPPEVEAAVYFCVLEALQNVAKYANASGATVRLFTGDGHLRFEVTDDGAGFDPDVTPRGAGLTNMADRMAALGGRIGVESTLAHGTTITGRIPITVSTGR